VRLLIALLLAFSLPNSATAQVEVQDGDSLRIDGRRIRFNDIDTPETRQTCGDWPAGVVATAYLKGLVHGRLVHCEHTGVDRYSRILARCYADGMDLQAALVRAGMAWAFVRYSSRYVSEEALARSAGLGVHRHGCLPAWEWRRL
jgi:endonuclease YncB( thermonuclease family)